MTKKELSIIVEVVTKAVLNNISLQVRKIVREELELNKGIIRENTVVRQPVKQVNKKNNLSNEIFGESFREVLESTRPNVRMPSTGSHMLDELIQTAPREEELTAKPTRVPKGETIPIEQLYINDVKGVTAEMAENIDYSAFFEKMDAIKSEPVSVPASQRGVFKVGKEDIIQEQKVGPTKVVKSYKG